MSNDGGLSPAVMQQLADMINTQIDKKLEKRDEQMMEMQKSMTNLMGEMKKISAASAQIASGRSRIWSPYSDGTDVNALYRSNSEKYCVCGDDSFQINLFTWPALKGAYENSKQYKGHCSHVLGLQFTGTDSHVVSVGGNDATILEWRHYIPDEEDSKTGKNIRFIRPASFYQSLATTSGSTGAPTISATGLSSNVSSNWTTPQVTDRDLNATM